MTKKKLNVDVDALVVDGNGEVESKGKQTGKQALKYLLCTASAGLIELITFSILNNALPDMGKMTFITLMPISNFIATFVALTLSILWNFTINRKFTFKSAGNVPRAMFLAFLFYVPFFPFKLWFNGVVPGMIVVAGTAMFAGVQTAIEICTMLLNGVLEFCWQKFFIYRNEANTALLKYAVGEVGEFGEIGVAEQVISGEQMHQMMSAGLDINTMTEKQMLKWIKNN